MAATTRALTPTHSGPFNTSIAPDPSNSLSSTSQSNSLAPIAAAAASAAALRASASPKSHKALSPRFSPQPLTGAAALEDERRLKEQKAAEEGRQMSPNPATAVMSSLLGNQTSPANTTMTDAPAATAQKALQIQSDQAGPATGEAMQTSPVSMSSMGSLEMSSVQATTAPTLATAMPTSNDNTLGIPDQGNERPAVDPGITGGPQEIGGPRAYTFPPPPGEDPRIPTPQRSISLQSMGHSGGSPRSGSGPRRHKCPYCSTDFTRHHNLKSHLLTHSQEKPYECETCNSRFRRLHDLKRHQKLHTGERPHTCQKCGRKFARGDALARHNKGQGGCAGRRSSFGVDSSGEPTMDGVEYTAEPEHMDEDEMNDDRRRVSEPGGRQNSFQANSRQSSTYPPLSAARYPGGNVAPMYPPTSTPSHQSSGPTAGSGSSIPYPGAHNNVFAQNSSMTESPKPISPGHPGQRHHGLPPPHAGANQLPSLSGIRAPGSHPGSMSSHSGSVASMRDLLGTGRGEVEWMNYTRDLEAKLEAQQRDFDARLAHMQEEHQKQLTQLQEELHSLKSGTNPKPA